MAGKELEVLAPSTSLRRFCLLAVALFCSCSPAPTPVTTTSPTPEDTRRVLVAMGDSLTEGYGLPQEEAYPAKLEAYLKSQGLDWRVENSGLSGETSSGAKSRVAWVLKLKPQAVLLEIGGNDGLRGIDPKVTKENITAIILAFQAEGIPVMLAGMKTLSNLGEDYTKAFEELYSAVAKERNVPLIPFFLEGVGGDPKLNQDDRIHPTAEGYQIVVSNIGPIVAKWLNELPTTKAGE